MGKEIRKTICVLCLVLALLIQVIAMINDWSQLSEPGAVGRGFLIVLNGIAVVLSDIFGD